MTPSIQVKQVLPAMEFGKKMSVEKEIGRMGQAKFNNVVWDESGHFIIYASLLGIKIVNLTTQRVSRQLAQREHLRCLAVGLFQVWQGAQGSAWKLCTQSRRYLNLKAVCERTCSSKNLTSEILKHI